MRSRFIITILLIVFLLPSVFSLKQESKARNNSDLDVTLVGLQSDGDCTIITIGEKQILIDAGTNTKKDTDTILEHICREMNQDSEKVWEYVIFTHPHEDHIGNAQEVFGLFEGRGWKIGTVIDYDFPEFREIDYSCFKNSNPALKYRKARDKYIENSKCEYFSASMLNENNVFRRYSLDVNCELTILWNFYDSKEQCYNKTNIDPNMVSVCCLITYKGQKILLTGDLGEAEEKELAEHSIIAPMIKNVTWFKASHHGSNKSNSDLFVDVIRPQYVAITYEHNAKESDDTFDRFLKYTDFIHLTSYKREQGERKAIYGELVYSFNGENVTIESIRENGSNKNVTDKTIWDILLDPENSVYLTDEMKSRRLSVYSFDEGDNNNKQKYHNCTLIKVGHFDMVIDCGSSDLLSNIFVEKLKDYVVDGVIECLVVTHNEFPNYSQIYHEGGLMDSFKIERIIDSGNKVDRVDKKAYSKYIERVGQLKESGTVYRSVERSNRLEEELIQGSGGLEPLKITIYGSDVQKTSENNNSLTTIIEYGKEKMVFVGDLEDYSYLNSLNNGLFTDVTYFKPSNAPIAISSMKGFETFYRQLNPAYVVIGTPIGSCVGGKTMFDERDKDFLCNRCEGVKKVFASGYYELDKDNGYRSFNGDLCLVFRETEDGLTKSLIGIRHRPFETGTTYNEKVQAY